MLVGASWDQYVGDEFPCPLCILQRMAMILALLGPCFILLAARSETLDAATFASGYGMSVLSAVVGAAICLRQLALHLSHGDPGYGPSTIGLHLYTWALIVFVVVAVMSSVNLIFARQLAPSDARFGWPSKVCVWLVAFVIGTNAIGVFVEAGFHPTLVDNPTCNQLFVDLGWRAAPAP